MRIRDYTPADRAACLAVFESNVPLYFVDEDREDFTAFLDDLTDPYLVIEADDGRIVGCGGYAIEPDTCTADFCWGMVSRDRHRTGLGRFLAVARLDRIRRDPNVRDVELNTSQHTEGFYHRLGFVTERVTPDAFAPGLHRHDMRLTLPR